MRTTNANFDVEHVHPFDPYYLIKFLSNEKLEGYFEIEDPGTAADRLTVDDETVTFTNCTDGEDVRLYKDCGLDYFDGYFSHKLKTKVTGASLSPVAAVWALSNRAADIWSGWNDGQGNLYLAWKHVFGFYSLVLSEYTGAASTTQDSATLSVNTDYYLTIVRDETVGTYGTLYCYIYSDSDRTTLVDTLSIALSAKKDFRYFYAFNSFDQAGANQISGEVTEILLEGEFTNIDTTSQLQRAYVQTLKGGKQTITPEEGVSSISGINFSLVDINDEITKLIGSDPYYFHRKRVSIEAGYRGMSDSDLLGVRTGWVTDIRMNPKATAWEFSVTDPLKWAQRKVFRSATSGATVALGGNPITAMLKILTSTGNGTNGTYDTLTEPNGIGLLEEFIDITGIEAVRDTWYQSITMDWTIDEPIQCKKFIEKEILKVFNAYPVIDGQGRFTIVPFKPPITTTTVQTFNEDVIVGIPKYDLNFVALINEVTGKYDWSDPTAGEFGEITRYINAESINNRGPGNREIVIESKGITTANDGVNLMQQRANRVFQRFSVPPVKITLKATFDQWLSEVGDIVPVVHSQLPDLRNSRRGIDEARMEIVSIEVDWMKGLVNVVLLDTGFAANVYGVISPIMTVVTGTSTTVFSVSSADAARYEVGWFIDLLSANLVAKETDHEITDITGTAITVTPAMSATPVAGDIVQFSSYDNVIAAQKLYIYICDDEGTLGSDNDPAHLITA